MRRVRRLPLCVLTLYAAPARLPILYTIMMHREYRRWSGARGYCAADFNRTVSDAGGFDVGRLLHTLIATTEEIDYREMLEWCGLQFARGGVPAREWTLEIRADATPAQKAHLASLLAHSRN